MRVKNLLVFSLGLILFVSLISATTTVHVKTLPRQDFYMTPISVGDGFNALAAPQFYSSDEYGDLTIDIANLTVNQFSLFFSLKDESGTTTFRKKFETSFLTGTEFNVTVAPEGAQLLETPIQVIYEEPIVNVSSVNLTEVVSGVIANLSANSSSNNETENPVVPVKKVRKSKINDSIINGEATNGVTDSKGFNIWYIIGIIVLVGIVCALFLSRNSGKGLNPYSRGIESHYERELSKAKKEFKHAKDRLELLRGEKEILAVERKLEADRKQLDSLMAKENKKFK